MADSDKIDDGSKSIDNPVDRSKRTIAKRSKNVDSQLPKKSVDLPLKSPGKEINLPSGEPSIDRAKRAISRRAKKVESPIPEKLPEPPLKLVKEEIKFGSGDPSPSSVAFKHINAEQQIVNGTITSELFAPGAVTVAAMNIDGNLNFNEYQALEFRIENVSVTPAPGNIGRVVYNTTSGQFLIDNGTAFVPVSSSGAVIGIYSDSNPVLAGTIQFISGANISLSQVGQSITISSTGGSSASYQQDLFTYSGSNTFTLTFTPVSNSQVILFNGLGLISGASYDYTLSGRILTLNAGIVLKAGDQILAIYSH